MPAENQLCPQCAGTDVDTQTSGNYFLSLCRRCGREEERRENAVHVITCGQGVLRYEP